jgi:hypothetical protein
MKYTIATLSLVFSTATAFSAFYGQRLRSVPSSKSQLDMKYKVAVVGGGMYTFAEDSISRTKLIHSSFLTHYLLK